MIFDFLNDPLFFILFWSITILTLGAFYFLYRKNILSFKEVIIIILVLSVYSLFLLIEEEILYEYVSNYVSRDFIFIIIALMTLVIKTFPITIIIYFIYKINNSNNQKGSTSKIVEDFFENGEFLTALKTSLPLGNNDKEFGLDYIPFMLQNVTEKKRKFNILSNRWLLTTGVLAGLFTIVVLYYSNQMINDTTSGIGQVSINLTEEIKKSNSYLRFIKPIKKIEDFKSFNINIDFFENLSQVSNSKYKDSLIIKYNLLNSELDIKEYEKYISDNLEKITDTSKPSLLASLKKEISVINTYLDSKEYSESSLRGNLEEVRVLSQKLDEKIKEPQNKLDELLKRLILSVIVISFFFTLLRFAAKQYKENYKRMVMAEDEDMYIRKFYIGIKNSLNNDDHKKIVLENFIAKNIRSEDKIEGITIEDSNILKSIVDKILNKMK